MVHEIRPDGEERHYLYHHGTHRPLGCYIKQPARDWRLHAYLTDARGAPIRLTDDRQEVVWEQALNPWGEAADGDEPWSQPIALAGQYRDDETGLHYNFARYYLPEAGCYLSADPIGADGGPNAYAYVADPVCWSDPLGLNGDDKCGGKSETYFRTMSREHFEELQRTGRMPGTSETFISPTQSFSEGYDGVTVEFQMKPGTTAALEEIGVRDNSRLTRQQHGDLPPVASGWKEKNAYFKGEGKQVNVGLGTGDALDTFNDNIESFRPVSQQGSGAPVTPSASSTK
jgi:RHS repeat-associated protein